MTAADAFEAELAAAGLGERAAELAALRRPSVRLTARSRVPDGDLAPGATKLGGRPDLPVAASWPTFRDLPLAFVAQVDLAGVAGLPGASVLPSGGVLSFFYAAGDQSVWGFDPADRGAWAVLHTPAGATTRRVEVPPGVAGEDRFGAVPLTPSAEVTYAPWEGLSGDPGETQAYLDVVGANDDVCHRLLGHPDPIQGDMRAECQLVSNGLYCGDRSGYDDPRAAGLLPGASEWLLLLQVDSEEAAGMMWGDAGRLYYWIRQDALTRREWGTTWLILQSA